jgi:predicted metal-dependent peptidase
MTDHKDILRRISRARIKLLYKQPFFATGAMRMQVAITEEIPTMGVDGRNLFVNPAFTAGLTETQIIGVLCHEVLHIINMHHLRKGKRDHKLWNVACDYAINPIVLDAGLELPDGRLLDPQYHGMSAEKIYSLLEKDPESKSKDHSACGEVMDGTQKADGSQMSADEIKVAEQQIKVGIAQAAEMARSQGKMTAAIEAMVGALLKPIVNWREVLRRFAAQVVPTGVSWSRPNRRVLAHGIRLPGMIKGGVGQLVIGIDTSGSIYADPVMTQQFLSEVTSICEEVKPEAIHVVFCDSKVKSAETFEHHDMSDLFGRLKSMVRGGGGTDFRPVFDWVDEQGINPAALIYLTDMEGVFPTTPPTYPVLWAKTTDHKAPFGDEVRLATNA